MTAAPKTPPSMSCPQLDAAVARVRESAKEFARLSLDERISLVHALPSGKLRSGAELEGGPKGRDLLGHLPSGTRVLVGYARAGRVTRGQSPRGVAGDRWNAWSTYYWVPGGAHPYR